MADLAGWCYIVRSIFAGRSKLLLLVAFGALVGALPGIHWVLTIAAILAVALLALVRPEWVVAGVVASVPVQSAVVMPFIRGEFTVTQIVMFGLIIGWGGVFWRRRIWLDSIVVGFMLVLAAFVISFIQVESVGVWAQETYRWAIAGLFYVIARSVLTKWEHVVPSLWAMVLGVMGVSLHAGYQLVFEPELTLFGAEHEVRVFSTFGSPNPLAAYLEFTVPLLLMALLVTWRYPGEGSMSLLGKAIFGMAVTSGMITLLFTQSRGGYLGTVLAVVVVWLWSPRSWRFAGVSIVAVVVVVLSLTSLGQSTMGRFSSLFEDEGPEAPYSTDAAIQDAGGRAFLWGAARGMLRDHPWTGVGAGQFDEHFRDYTTSWLHRMPLGQAHNVWLQMGAQAGVPGIAAYAVWLAASIWGLVTAWRRATSAHARAIITGALAVFAAYCIHSLVDYLNVLSLGLQLSVITAIALNLAPAPLTRYGESHTSAPQGAILVPSV